MKRYLYIVFILCSISLCKSQVWEEWRASYIGPGNGDFLASMCIDNNGNVYVTGNSRNTINSFDYTTVKYSTSGVQQWVSRYNGIQNSGASAYSIAVDRFGNAYVTGVAPVSSSGPSKTTTIKYNQSGVQCWVSIFYGQIYNAAAIPYSIVTDFNANVYITGISYTTNSGADFTTLKYDSAGAQQWVAFYHGGYGYDEAHDIVLDISGNVYVTGYSWGDTTYNDIVTVKYNSLGIEQWAVRYNGTGDSTDIPYDLKVDNNGNVYVTGKSWGGFSIAKYDYITIKYNSSGVEQWAKRYNGNNNWNDISYSLAVDDSGNVYVTGESYVNNHVNYGTIKYSPSGAQLWIRYYNYVNQGDFGSALTIDNRGGIYVTGSSWGGLFGTRDDFATIKYSPAGEQLWVIRTDSSIDERPVAIAVDTSGNVYVAGNSGRYLTIKYNQLTGINPVSNEIPHDYRLYQNYPNPFNPKTNIRFDIAKAGLVKLVVYDVTGKVVSELINGEYAAGKFEADFDASNLSTGIYFYKLEAEGFIQVKKMILVK